MSADPTTLAQMTALPVEVAVGGVQGAAVRSFIEGSLGWQAVDGATRGLVPPVVRLVDGDAPIEVAGPPAVLLLASGTSPAVAVRAALDHRPLAVVVWPDERGDLAGVVTDVLAAAAPAVANANTMRVGGACGGVGTTTVALALAGLVAWRGARTLAIVRGPAHADAVPHLAPADLAGLRVWDGARPARGVPGLRVVRCDVTEATPMPSGVEAVVHDVGASSESDVLVVRRDRPGLAAVANTTAAVTVIVDAGPVPAAAFARELHGARAVTVPWSARVARAAACQRLPASLPPTWLRALQPVLGPGAGRS